MQLRLPGGVGLGSAKFGAGALFALTFPNLPSAAADFPYHSTFMYYYTT